MSVSSVQAEVYIEEYTYDASEADSKLSSRAIALDQVNLLLLQEIGTHIRHEMNISKDQTGKTEASEDIQAITAGVTQTEILDEKWNGETYWLKAKIIADTQKVLNALEEFKKNKTKKNIEQIEQIEQFKNSQLQLKAAREEMAALRLQLSQASTTIEKEKIAVKYVKQVDELSLFEMYTKGNDYYQNDRYKDAVYWYRKAAGQGYANAQNTLGVMHLKGQGVKQSYKQAVAWYRKAAEQGLFVAQYNLG